MTPFDSASGTGGFNDQPARDRLRTDHERSFFVQAGAGTGKTTALVSRVVALIAAGRVTIDRLAAITFTEAAASELRGRIRRAIEAAVRQAATGSAERERLASATERVDLAAIQTIHSFASALLRTYAVEAGLPPGFGTLDQIQAALAFDERFRCWLFDEIPALTPENQARRESIRHALQIGITLDQLRDLALGFEENTDLLGDVTYDQTEAPPLLVFVHRLGAELAELPRYVPLARKGEDDPLVREIRRLEVAALDLAAAADEPAALAALLGVGNLNQRGNMNDWDRTEAKENPVRLIKGLFKERQAEIDCLLEAHRAAALAAVLAYTREFTIQGVERRRREGVATFHDLLTWARDLLRTNREARRSAQRQFDCIFVDEFQDTDPLQAEIVWFLVDDPDLPPIDEWHEARVVPGKLLVVGDPKQSIYHFRRADIGLYRHIYTRFAPDARLDLVQNFRSVPSVLDWVNHFFEEVMEGADGVQAEYVALLPTPDSPTDHGGVYRIGERLEGNAAAIHAAEAAAVADAVRTIVAEKWSVRDKDAGVRPARYRDVCVLLRTRANLRNLERALADQGVPYRVEGGSLVLDTQEVRELVSGLCAIDDPSDQVAIVAALRSPAYACSDVDLLDWVEAGGRFAYDQPIGERTGPVAVALESLRHFHEARLDRSVAATIEAFTRERMLAVGAFGQPRPREAWRRLRYVAQQARELAAAGRPTLRALVDWLDELKRTEFRDTESAVPDADEDAVRLMTMHGAKGLEFPIVVLTGLGSAPSNAHRGIRLIPDRARQTIEVGFASFQTPGFGAASEREVSLEAAEQVRLLYVAATRARDHLVLCLHHAKPSAPAARIVELLTNADPALCRTLVLANGNSSSEQPAAPGELADRDPADHEQSEDAWLAERRALVARLTSMPAITATQVALHAGESASSAPAGPSIAREATLRPDRWRQMALDELWDGGAEPISDLADPDASPASSSPDRAVRLGLAVHAALADIGDSPGAGRQAVFLACRDRGIADQYATALELVQAVRRAPAYQRAVAAPRHWHEVPVGVEVEGTLLEGRIDLLWEQPDGSLGILDVKTDRIDPAAAEAQAALYAPQLAAYALAIGGVTRKRVSRLEILFAAAGGAVVAFEDVDARVEQVHRAITQRNGWQTS